MSNPKAQAKLGDAAKTVTGAARHGTTSSRSLCVFAAGFTYCSPFGWLGLAGGRVADSDLTGEGGFAQKRAWALPFPRKKGGDEDDS